MHSTVADLDTSLDFCVCRLVSYDACVMAIGMSKTYVLQNTATAYSMLLVLCILYIVCFREQIGVLLIPSHGYRKE